MPDATNGWQPGDPDRRSVTQLPTSEIQELKQAFREFTAELRDLRKEVADDIKAATKNAEDTFVRKDNFAEIRRGYDLEFKGLHEDVATIEKRKETEDTWRKNVNLTVLIALGGNLVLIALGVVGFLLRK